MALLTKKQFAKLCRVNTGYLSVIISRGAIQITKKGKEELIDDENEINRAYFLKKQAKFGPNPEPVKENTPVQAALSLPEQGESTEDPEEIAKKEKEKSQYDDTNRDLHRLSKEKIDLDNQKRQQEIQILKLRQQKLTGEVVPTEAVRDLFHQHTKSIMVAFKNAGEEFITMIGSSHGLNIDDISKMRGDLIKVINQAVDDSVTQSIAGLDAIVSDHTEKKEVGERS